MPKSRSALKTLQDFKDRYGDEEGERIYYATANKQGRDPDTFKKESLQLIDDLVIEYKGEMMVFPKGTLMETVGTGAIAMVPAALPVGKKKKKKKKDDEDEVEEASNSQISDLQLDH